MIFEIVRGGTIRGRQRFVLRTSNFRGAIIRR